MLLSLLSAALPSLLIVIGMVMVTATIFWWKRTLDHQSRRSPLTKDLLRSPGQSLREKLQDLEIDIALRLMGMLGIPLLLYATHLSQSYFGRDPESVLRIAGSLILGIAAFVVMGRALQVKLLERRILVLGLEGELAVAEELNQLMLDGCKVFHDVPIQYGNIDHVVISPSGVYAVNTKMWGKQTATVLGTEVTVDYERNVIRMPDREIRIPVEKAETEVRWLSQQLASAIGEPVDVEAMLALPGWFIKERIGRGTVFVFNPKNPRAFFLQNRERLSPVMVQRIAHQVEQLCRNVKPSFRKEKAWAQKT